MFKLDLEKVRNQRSNCQHLLDHRKSKRIPEIFCFTDYAKVFGCVDHNKLWEILKEKGITEYFPCLLQKKKKKVKKQQLELDMQKQTGSKLGKEYVKLFVARLLIQLICRVHHAKCWAG